MDALALALASAPYNTIALNVSVLYRLVFAGYDIWPLVASYLTYCMESTVNHEFIQAYDAPTMRLIRQLETEVKRVYPVLAPLQLQYSMAALDLVVEFPIVIDGLDFVFFYALKRFCLVLPFPPPAPDFVWPQGTFDDWRGADRLAATLRTAVQDRPPAAAPQSAGGADLHTAPEDDDICDGVVDSIDVDDEEETVVKKEDLSEEEQGSAKIKEEVLSADESEDERERKRRRR